MQAESLTATKYLSLDALLSLLWSATQTKQVQFLGIQ